MSKRVRSEQLESLVTISAWAFMGAVTATASPNGNVVIFTYAAMCGLLTFLNCRTGFSSTKLRAADKLDAMRYRGIYPREGHGTDEDVKRLKTSGERIYAVQLHREIHGGTLREAIDAVNAL